MLGELLEWARERYAREVESLPDTNLLKPTLKTTWSKVVRKLESATRRRQRQVRDAERRAISGRPANTKR